jgi:hypothetical protein
LKDSGHGSVGYRLRVTQRLVGARPAASRLAFDRGSSSSVSSSDVTRGSLSLDGAAGGEDIGSTYANSGWTVVLHTYPLEGGGSFVDSITIGGYIGGCDGHLFTAQPVLSGSGQPTSGTITGDDFLVQGSGGWGLWGDPGTNLTLDSDSAEQVSGSFSPSGDEVTFHPSANEWLSPGGSFVDVHCRLDPVAQTLSRQD